MSAALFICGLVIAFQAGVGFLFGQWFAGHLSLAASLTGLAGLACAFGAFMMALRPGGQAPWVRWAAPLTGLGLLLDIVEYYRHLAMPGNYYPWLLVLPFAACVAWVGLVAHRRLQDGAAA